MVDSGRNNNIFRFKHLSYISKATQILDFVKVKHCTITMKFQSLSFVLSSAAVLAEAAVIGNKSGFPDLERFKIATEVVSGNKKFDGLYSI